MAILTALMTMVLWLLVVVLFSLLLVAPYCICEAFASAATSNNASPSSSRTVPCDDSGRNMLLDADTAQFHQLAGAAVDLSSAVVVGSSDDVDRFTLSIQRSTRNWDMGTRQSYLYRIPFSTKGSSSQQRTAPPLLPPTLLDASIQLYLPSPSGKKTVVIKNEKAEGTNNPEDGRTVIEVWQVDALLRKINVPTHDTGDSSSDVSRHGKIINDPTGFGVPTWNPDETHLLYVAERRPPKTVPFWTSTVNNGKEEDDDSAEVMLRGQQYVVDPIDDDNSGGGQQEHWGERYPNQSPLLDLYVLNLETGRLGRVKNVPGSKDCHDDDDDNKKSVVTLGQPQWHPAESSKIAYTAWDANQPKRLGMVYCRNRKSAVYESDISALLQRLQAAPKYEKEKEKQDQQSDQSYNCLSSGLFYARSPRYVRLQGNDDDGSATTKLIFLASDRPFVSHDACMGLYLWDDEKKSANVVVEVIDRPWEKGGVVEGMGFPGLFLGQLPTECDNGQGDTTCVFTTTLWGSMQRIVRVNIVSGDVSLLCIANVNKFSSQSIVAWTPTGDLLVSEGASNQPARLWLVQRDDTVQPVSESGSINVQAQMVATLSPIAATTFSALEPYAEPSFEMKILSTAPPSIDGATIDPIQSILLFPTNAKLSGEKIPLIVIPHGGPHSCSTSAYSPGFAYLACTYAVLFPNYRGSTGFGQLALDSLLTRIGTVDVEDVMTSTRHSLNEFSSLLDADRVGICGGSHGGFLTAQCTSQYPDFFKAAAMRNPVTNIASMYTSTDIPDWCMAEVFAEYDASKFRGPTSEQLIAMYSRSPVSRVDEVKAPTLIALGMSDLRVPPSQGIEWFHSLRSIGVPTKLLRYPKDNHALDTVTTEADHWIHIRRWFDEYL